MKLENVKRAYFLGIGGIGMSAIARWLHAQGVTVSGYDKTPTPLTQALISEGISVHFEDAVENIEPEVLKDRDGSLIVFTPAIPKDHKEFIYLRDQGCTLYKRSQVLGLICQAHKTVAVAGTHGKTTTSSMVAWLLHQAGLLDELGPELLGFLRRQLGDPLAGAA